MSRNKLQAVVRSGRADLFPRVADSNTRYDGLNRCSWIGGFAVEPLAGGGSLGHFSLSQRTAPNLTAHTEQQLSPSPN